SHVDLDRTRRAITERHATPRSVPTTDVRVERVVHDPPMTEEGVDCDATELAAGFRAGDEDAVRQVYRRHGRAMYSVARSILGDRDAAADAVQQAFLQAWRAAGTFDASRPMGPWLAQITRRVCIDGLRRDSRRPRSA